MKHHFHTAQWVPYPRERVFAFFANPENLPPLMPPWQHARIEKLQLTANHAAKGSIILITFRPIPFLPLRLPWEAHITEFHWNNYFCDEQQKGPFKSFRHCHRITETERSGVKGATITDEVDYELPLSLPSILVNQQIKSLFAHRQKTLPSLLAKTIA
jgi:ligand-binding SRPBCC domain-containing protein